MGPDKAQKLVADKANEEIEFMSFLFDAADSDPVDPDSLTEAVAAAVEAQKAYDGRKPNCVSCLGVFVSSKVGKTVLKSASAVVAEAAKGDVLVAEFAQALKKIEN